MKEGKNNKRENPLSKPGFGCRNWDEKLRKVKHSILKRLINGSRDNGRRRCKFEGATSRKRAVKRSSGF